MAEKHLWEIEHPYYCNEGNCFAPSHNQPTTSYESWADFVEDEGASDLDMNLVFRWDWRKADPNEEAWCNKTDVLLLFFMGQRKGLYRWVEITVQDSDEQAIRDWLSIRWEHLRRLWQGISDFGQDPERDGPPRL